MNTARKLDDDEPQRKVSLHPVRKVSDDELEFVLSDETKDRYGDIIMADGWALASFRKNPIALFNHMSSFVIGTWTKVRVEGKQLLGVLKLAKKGTSQRIDEIISLVEQGILKATSVGFQPIEREFIPDDPKQGILFKKQDLLETSVVAVPANPSAVLLARSLVSEKTVALVFGESANRTRDDVRRSNGESARANQGSRKTPPMKLAERITAAQERLVSTQAVLEQHLEESGDDPSAEQNTLTEEINGKIAAMQKTLENLLASEKSLANSTALISANDNRHSANDNRPFAVPKKKIEPLDYILRSLVVLVKNHGTKEPLTDTLKAAYGEDVVTKGVMDVVLRAATVPADTVTPAWAGALVNTAIGEFFELLLPQSVYPGLSNIGGRFTFGRNGIISLPTRSATPTVAGSFVAQGGAIPVRQAAFTAVTLTPKKMGVITTMTREIRDHSTPALEGILRQSIQEDTSVAIDSVLLDANPATTTRPAGILNGASTAAGTAGGGFAAVVADIKAMLGALITATNGAIRKPAWIMNPIQAISLGLTQNAGGDFPFGAEVNAGRFQGYPLIQSTTVPAGTVILVDAADFFSANGDDPRFDVSDQAVLHMEDTTPLAIGTPGSPAVVAAPVRSLWQTDSIGIRMILDINWAFRRTGVVVVRTAVTW